MSIDNFRTSTFVERAVRVAAVSSPLQVTAKDDNQPPAEKAAEHLLPEVGLIADRVTATLRSISVNSLDAIDGLVSDLRALQGKLFDECDKIDQDITEFARFSQSLTRLNQVVTDGIANVRADDPAE